jgi:glyoxalase family protein
MRLEGVHHVTAITGDVLKNVDFYARVLGLRLVGKSVNQDDPSVYHVFFSDEHGSPGADITFFEYKGAVRGRAGSGMVHRVLWRVTGEPALAFWEQRLAKEGVAAKRADGALRFADPEGLEHELLVARVPDEPRIADHPEIAREMALQGFHGVRAYGGRIERSGALLENVLGGKLVAENTWELRGDRRGGTIQFDTPPAERGIPGAGTVHHVAWGTSVAEHPKWVDELAGHGCSPRRSWTVTSSRASTSANRAACSTRSPTTARASAATTSWANRSCSRPGTNPSGRASRRC